MRPTLRLLAAHSPVLTQGSLLKKPAPLALLPPIQLYRRVLRAHRKLPREARVLGDEYVKAEFRLHRNIDNPMHIVGFLTEWQLYAQQVEGETWKDVRLEAERVNKMSDEQVGQLYELMQALKNKGEGEPEGEPKGH